MAQTAFPTRVKFCYLLSDILLIHNNDVIACSGKQCTPFDPWALEGNYVGDKYPIGSAAECIGLGLTELSCVMPADTSVMFVYG